MTEKQTAKSLVRGKTRKKSSSSKNNKMMIFDEQAIHLDLDWSDCDPNDMNNPKLFINRELSLLEFNQRVLDQAYDEDHPLLERVKFLAIVGKNLDEFFMVRLAILIRRIRLHLESTGKDGLTAKQLYALASKRLEQLKNDQTDCWQNTLLPLLEKEKIYFLEQTKYTAKIKAYLQEYYLKNIHPTLTPIAFDPGHPFPHISNLSLNMAITIHQGEMVKFARLKIPAMLSRLIQLPKELAEPGSYTFVYLEDVIQQNIHSLFREMKVDEVHLFRVTRDTNLEIQEENSDDLMATVHEGLQELAYGDVTLLEVQETMPEHILEILIENFGLEYGMILRTNCRLGFGDWFGIMGVDLPHLKDKPIHSRDPLERVTTEHIFEQIKQKDILVHHPYESFVCVERFLKAAAYDPDVIAIKMTMYRVAKDSSILEYLIEASQNGKQVSVLVELKARFDEMNNITWAKQLESHGIYVTYGLVNLKTHCKLCLVIRKERKSLRGYVHIGTGNYNRATARIYTDLGLFTVNPNIVADVTDVFNGLTGYSNQTKYHHLLVAPRTLRSGIIEKIIRETKIAQAGKSARIIMKMNSLEDIDIIQILYKASQAGVKIDLIIRGICGIRPGIPQISDNIRVISVIGRFLEHSRVYYFQNDGNDELWIGSADLMERNLSRRVETLCPILNAQLRKLIYENILMCHLKDNMRSYVMKATGQYEKVQKSENAQQINSQETLIDYYSHVALEE